MRPDPSHQSWLANAIMGHAPVDSLPDEAGWREILSACEWNGVTALLHRSLESQDEVQGVPAWFRESLKSKAMQIAANELWNAREIRYAIEALQKADIQFLLLKGTPLAYSLFPEPYLRERCDTDIMFRNRADTEAAWRVLEASGYRRGNAISGEFISSQFSCYKVLGRDLVNAFDMHWKLSNNLAIANVFEFEEMRQSATLVPKLGEGIQALGNPHAFLLACMHRIANINFGIADRLVWLYDIYLLSKSLSDDEWAKTETLTLEKNLNYMVESGSDKTAEFFPVTLPDSFREQLRMSGTGGQYTPKEAARGWQVQLMDMRTLPGWKARLVFLKENLLPPTGYMKKKYNAPSLALPFYYCLRIVQGAPKLFRKR